MVGLILKSPDKIQAALVAILEGAPGCRLFFPGALGVQGRYVKVFSGHLHVQFDVPPKDLPFEVGMTVEIVSQFRGLAAKKSCRLLSVHQTGVVELSIPDEIVLTDAREYARLVLPPHVCLSIETEQNRRLEGVSVLDVSHGGFRLGGSEESLQSLAPGTVGHCRISLGEDWVRLDYAIMWKRADSVGFMIIGMRQVDPRDKSNAWVKFLDEVVIAALQNPA